MKEESLEKIATGPRTFHHFWPRLWSTAKPLGGDAKKEMSTVRLPPKRTPVDDIDSRIFVQGGDWILEHQCHLTTEDGAVSADKAACVMLLPGSKLCKKVCPRLKSGDIVQGVLKSVIVDSLECELRVPNFDDEQSESESDDDSGGCSNIVKTELTNADIWWCFPFWVAASYTLHYEKIPVKSGFYFLAEPGQAFCIVTISWDDRDVFLKPKVDGRNVTKFSWLCGHRASAMASQMNFKMFEKTEDSTSDIMRGEQFTFTKRKTSEQPCKGWQEEVQVCGAVSISIYRALEADESGLEAASDPESEPEPEEEKVKGEDRQDSDAEGGVMLPPTKRQRKVEGNTQGKVDAAVVKQDSKWAFHVAVAPTGGKKMEVTSCDSSKRRGQILGLTTLHYRDKPWLESIDLLLSDEQMRINRLKRNAGLIVGEAFPEGATKDQAIVFDDPPVQPQAATPAVVQGGPVRASKVYRVNFHEGGLGTPVTHVVKVPKTDKIPDFKEMVKEALADEDVFGEEIRTIRLQWKYEDADGEVNISAYSDAADLENSLALHVYATPPKI